MALIPIYQMTYGQDNHGNEGLVFASEQENTTNQSIMYVIPILENYEHAFEIIDSLEFDTIYFPFLLGEKYFNLKARLNFPELIFDIPETNGGKIVFQIEGDHQFTLDFNYPFRSKRKFFKKLKYVGFEKGFVVKNNGFIALLPIDIFEMDALYNEHQGIFVGMTPKFGELLKDNFG